jgi:hyperosmotically inducible periplasmic protein
MLSVAGYGTPRNGPRPNEAPRDDGDDRPSDTALATQGLCGCARICSVQLRTARIEPDGRPEMGAERMRSNLVVTGIVGLTFAGLGLGAGVGLRVAGAQQPGVAERVGETLDSVGRGLIRGAQEVTDSVRRRFEVVRAEVSRMGVPSRVYSRIHWDKTLVDARIEVLMMRDGLVLLRGVVPDAAAKVHAVDLARDTVDVTGVIDELTMVIPTPMPMPTTTTTTVSPTSTSLARPR